MIDLARDIIDLIESRAHNGRNAGRIVEALFTKIFTALRRDPRFDALTRTEFDLLVADAVADAEHTLFAATHGHLHADAAIDAVRCCFPGED
jgi:hypothetical protein